MTDYINDGAKIQEALDLVQEECAEIIQIISKIRRFGFESYSPYDEKHITNHTLLQHEVGDLSVLMRYLLDLGVLDQAQIEARMEWKEEKLQKTSTLFCG